MRKLFTYLTPPVWDDKDKAREANYSHYIILSVIAALSYSTITKFNLEDGGETHFKLVSLGVILFLFYLNKIKKLKSPILILVITGIAICTGLMFYADGIGDEVILVFPILLFVASLRFDRISLFITLLTEMVVIIGIGYLEINGYLTNALSYTTTTVKLGSLIVILTLTSFIVDLLVNDIKAYIITLKSKSAELAKANQQLYNSNATKDKFFSIIAHDLRSPFQGLLGIANILENLDDELTQEEKKDFISRMNVALKRQYDFLEELLLWGKFQRNAIDFDPQVCSLTEIVERNKEVLAGNLYKKKLSLIIESPNEVTLKCDENLISTVIRNLLSNSIKYTPAGGKIWVIIEVGLNYITIEVKDSGIGLSEERIQKLFKIETNNSTRGTEDEAGTGLGLILCKEIVQKHEGEISVKSEEGKGSSFFITLPKEKN